MSSYQDEMFEFFTSKREHFISAFEIYQKFPDVKNRLITEFWDLVVDKLTIFINKSNWKITKEENEYLDLYFDDLIYPAFIGLNNKLEVGLYVDIENERYANIDREKIEFHFKNLDLYIGMKTNNNWLGYKFAGYDFNNIETLKRLTDNQSKEDFAEELAKMLFDFAIEMKPHIDKMLKMTKKKYVE